MDVVVLANSNKIRNRCLAGIDLSNGRWVRPLGAGEHGALFPREYMCEGGHTAAVMDVVRFQMIRRAPAPHQPEDIMTRMPWTFVRRASQADKQIVKEAVIPGPELFRGVGSCIPYGDIVASPVGSSLTAIKPRRVVWMVDRLFERKRRRVIFDLMDRSYELAVTDPILIEKLDLLGEGIWPIRDHDLGFSIENLHFTVSLGEPFPHDNCCYKLVVAAYDLP
jgi:hypothetical protein